jgi:transcriptional regulator with XRE-family HTH domain
VRDPAWAAAFGRRVRGAREYAEMTQQEVADRVGRSREWVANVESGRHDVPLHMGIALAGALVVPLDDLVPP